MGQMKKFAKIISEQRKEKNMTQEELACRLGITPQAISKWENGIGLPDVTLFPLIAEELDISIEALFGVEKKQKTQGAIPATYQGLSLVADTKRYCCFSDKDVSEKTEDKIFFRDGSIADMINAIVTNNGKGEIRILPRNELYEEDCVGGDIVSKEIRLSSFQSMSVTLNRKCNLKVIPDKTGEPRILIRGKEDLLGNFQAEVEEETLTVQLRSPMSYSGNDPTPTCSIEIYVPFEKGKTISLTSNGHTETEIKPDFEDGELKINGSGSIVAANFESLCVRINGSGDFQGQSVSKQSKFRISGSGGISLKHAANPNIKISGSGDISCESAKGEIEAQIAGCGGLDLGKVDGRACFRVAGSGDFSCFGELDFLKLRISGSGGLDGSRLSVREADIHVQGSGDVELARIKEKSVERLSKNATLRVSRRG